MLHPKLERSIRSEMTLRIFIYKYDHSINVTIFFNSATDINEEVL